MRCCYMNTETALITGASRGIGLHLAREFAKHQHPLVLVAPIESELQQVASQLKNEFGVTVGVIAKDLERPEAARAIFDRLLNDRIDIDILVNNAGHGQKGKFWEVPIERDLSILRLNIEAVLRLTRAAIASSCPDRTPKTVMVTSAVGALASTSE